MVFLPWQLETILAESESVRARIDQRVANNFPPPLLLERACLTLGNVVHDIQKVVDDCNKTPRPRALWKTSRVKWVLKSGEMQQLIESTTKCRMQIQVALGLLLLEQSQEQIQGRLYVLRNPGNLCRLRDTRCISG